MYCTGDSSQQCPARGAQSSQQVGGPGAATDGQWPAGGLQVVLYIRQVTAPLRGPLSTELLE